jgi:hypothetical protein
VYDYEEMRIYKVVNDEVDKGGVREAMGRVKESQG